MNLALNADVVEAYGKPSTYNPRLAEFARAPVYKPPEGITRLGVFTISGDRKIVMDVSDPDVLAKETNKYQAGLALTMSIYEVPTDDLHSYVAGGSPRKLEVQAESGRPAERALKTISLWKETKEAILDIPVTLVTDPGSIFENIGQSARSLKHAWQNNRQVARSKMG